MLRVLQLIPTLRGGGAERQLSLLAAPLAVEGVEVHVGFQHSGVNQRTLEESHAHLHEIRIKGNHDPRLLYALTSLIKSVQPDVVHTWLMSMDTVGGVAARWCGVPWLLSERTAPQAYEPQRTKERVRRYLARNASGVIGNSTHGLDYWQTVIPAVHRFLVPNAVSIEEIEQTLPIARKELPLPHDPPLVVYAGRFAVEKNTHVLVDALIDVVGRGDAVALLCGEGPERPALEAKVRNAGMSDRIAISGYRDDIWAVLRAAHCAVSLSHFEGSANVVLEAMACGCPQVLSDIPAHRADAGDVAWFVDGQSSYEVAAAIRDVLSSPEEAERRTARGRSRAADHTLTRCAREMAKAYASTVRVPAGSQGRL